MERRWDFAREGDGESGRDSVLNPDIGPGLNPPDLPIPNSNGNFNGNQERMDPAMVNFIMQSTATAQTVRLRKLEELKIPLGEISIDITVTSHTIIRRFTHPLISVSLVNDGPSDVFIEVNQAGYVNTTRAPIQITESYVYNAGFPIIESISFNVVAGTSARIRGRGKTGRRADFNFRG